MTLKTIDRYTIKAQLGSGEIATVYQAYDPRFEREVAIKVLLREFLNDKTFLPHFEREAKAIAALEHAATVPVYDFGEHEGQPYLVMRYMHGGSLAARLEAAPLPLDEIATILKCIGTALDEAHSQGITHRDVKPGNILFDEEGAAYLSDFGIAKVAEATAQLTDSEKVGTPAYTAPEMVKAGEPTPLTDIYALGVTLFEMLAGRQPYGAKTPMGVLMAHVNNPVPDVLALRPGLPDEVQAIVERGMAKDPADRYPSAGELAADLRTALQAEKPRIETVLNPAKRKSIPASPKAPAKVASAPRTVPPEKQAATQEQDKVSRFPTCPAWLVKLRTPVITALIILALVIAGGEAGLLPPILGDRTAVTPSSPNDTEKPISPRDQLALQLAETGVTSNADWTPYTEVINGVEMALVPAGCFQMGSNEGESDEQPVHKVCFDAPFWIDVYEVTNEQYGEAACKQSSSEPDRPHVCVTWQEAKAHCESRGARLPTEAEWEYTARGPDGLVYPWGNDFIADNVIYGENSDNQIGVVGSRPGGISWVGAYDLSGNVWEWINDWYLGTYYSTLADGVINPTGPSSGGHRVLRGGSWNYLMGFTRSANRDKGTPDLKLNDPSRGFRCALSYQP